MAEKVVEASTFAEIMRISPRTVTKLLREKRLPGYKFCGRWFIKVKTLEAIQSGELRVGSGDAASALPGSSEEGGAG